MSTDTDYGYSGYAVEDPLSSCNPKSMTQVIGLTLTYTDATGNASATVSAVVMSNGTYTISGWGQQLDGDYTGGHMHDGPIQGSVFYDGPAPKPHDPARICFDLVGITQINVGDRSLRSGANGTGSWRNPPSWVKLGSDTSLTWRVN